MGPVLKLGLLAVGCFLAVGCVGFNGHASPGSTEALAAAQIAGIFLERVLNAFPFGPHRLLRRKNIEFDYGVVYAAIGPSALQKASVSVASVRSTLGLSIGTFLVTSGSGLASLAPHAESFGRAFWWDYVASLDGFGINFTALPEFEAFTIAKKTSPSGSGIASTTASNRKTEKERKVTKPLAWAAVRQLRSAKMAALLLALEVFKVATIFLDADTLVCDSLRSVFEVVVPSGPWFAFAPAPSEHHGMILQRMYGIRKGDAPPEPNTGVVAISTCDGARRVLKRWNEIYWHESLALGSIQNPMDQPPLRAAIHLENASWTPLSQDINCRGHVKNVNAALPMRCGGFDAAHWEALARASILDAVGTIQLRGASLSSAKDIKGGVGCAVLHSHAVPRHVRSPSSFQHNALVLLDDDSKRHKIFGFGLEKVSTAPTRGSRATIRSKIDDADDTAKISLPQPSAVVAIFHLDVSPRLPRSPRSVQDAVDWRGGNWRNQTELVGSMAKDACATALMPCAIVLVLVDPLVQVAADKSIIESKDFFQRFDTGCDQNTRSLHHHTNEVMREGTTLLDGLLPLAARDLAFLNNPRGARVDRYGPGNVAEIADAISRLETEAFLVLLADTLDTSQKLLNLALKLRPEARKLAEDSLLSVVAHNTRGRLSLKAINQSTMSSIHRLLVHDTMIYDAAARLFKAQCVAAQHKGAQDRN